MAVYRDDPDMQFLRQCDNEALDLMMRFITYDPKDSVLRWTETQIAGLAYRITVSTCLLVACIRRQFIHNT